MGKIKKTKMSSAFRGDPSAPSKMGLADDIESLKLAKTKDRNKTRNRQEEQEFIDSKMSAKILSEARKQHNELQEEFGIEDEHDTNNNRSKNVSFGFNDKQTRFGKNRFQTDDASESDSEGEELDESSNYYQNEDIEINEVDEKAFDTFMSDKPNARRTIADIIMEKLTEKKTEIQTQLSDIAQDRPEVQVDERVVNMYKQIRDVLSRYRSGKLPKAFKILPSLNHWEHILYITEPDNWTAAAIYQATRIFASNLNAKMAQRFYNLVLLPRIRDDIAEYKRLNFHLYMAIRKALFKPAAFFKGVLLPLCESRNCTLREAIIIGSVLAKNSIPMLHSAAALLKIAELEYSGANSIFIKTLLDKKYALPFRVIDALVNHFVLFQRDKRQLPVLWHQALLTFVQRYKEDISSEQKEALLELIKVHSHNEITPEIRREITNSKCRDLEDANSQISMDLNFDD